MFTINYKGFLIHGYFDKPQYSIDSMLRTFKSLHAAKCHVSRVMIPAIDAAMMQFAETIK